MKIDPFITISTNVIDKSTIVFTPKTREWCRLPYPGHPRGCSDNYGKCETCPPSTPYRVDILEKHDKFVLVHATFDINAYAEEMRKVHPDWSERQLRNSRLWQSQLKSKMKAVIAGMEYDELLGAGSGFDGRPSMEAAGIFVLATLHRNKIPFDVKAREFIKMVCLLAGDGRTRELEEKIDQKKKPTLYDFITSRVTADVDFIPKVT